jgi:malate dehydrogenase (oxaloacetate-decarboxylating)
MMAAVGVAKSTLAEQRIVIFGAGSAGLGIARQLRDAMVSTDGLARADANARFWLVDRAGLLTRALADAGNVREGVDEFVRADAEFEGKDAPGLLDVVRAVRPTALIGVSTAGGAFTEDVLREMARHTPRPIVFPLSNPSKLAEVDPAKANEWTDGKALLATGSPFPPAKMPSGKDYMCVPRPARVPLAR